MATVNSTRRDRVLQIVRRVARREFARHWDWEQKVTDTVSVAWQGLQAYPDAPPGKVAMFAIRHVRSGRHFQQSTRSIDGRTDNWRQAPKPRRASFSLAMAYARRGQDPAEIAGFLIDFEAWQSGLTDRKREMLDLFLAGEETGTVAAKIGVTPGRVSQVRRELSEDWLARMG